MNNALWAICMKMKDINKRTVEEWWLDIRSPAEAHSLCCGVNMTLPCSGIHQDQACSYGF